MSIENKTAPIGVFDSGVGGLTVAGEIVKRLPHENLIYLGDTARVPYGTKSQRTVIAYSKGNAGFLVQKGIKLLVVACNTASSVSIPILTEELNIPVVGVIGPGAKKAAEITKTGKIGVIGTYSTVKSGAYKKALENISSGLEVHSEPCPLFVGLADEGWTDGEVTKLIAEQYLSGLKNTGIDTLVLGCTHYPLLKKVIQNTVGDNITLVDSAEETAIEIKNVLEEQEALNPGGLAGTNEFYLTDVSDTFISIAGRFLGAKIENIEMVDIAGAPD